MSDAEPDPRSEPAPRYGEKRPRPQYGEYATPAEVAAATGIPLPDKRGESESVARLSEPIVQTPPAQDARLRHAAPPSERPVAARHPGQLNNLLTTLLLVFGIWNTVTSIPSLLDFGTTLSEGFVTAGYASVGFGTVAHVVGIVLLVSSFLVLVAAVGLSLRRIRMGRRSVAVPLIAGASWFVAMLVGVIVAVANTPGVLAILQNHS